jgi:hypothetical protein
LVLCGGKISKKSENKQEKRQKSNIGIAFFLAFFLKDYSNGIDYKERHPYG